MPRYALDAPDGLIRIDVAPLDGGFRWLRLDERDQPTADIASGFVSVGAALRDAVDQYEAEHWVEEAAPVSSAGG